MNLRTLILRGLRFHWRAHLGVLLGAAVGSAALIGALVVGDSVRGSLREMALQRLGWVDAALAPADRFFTQELAAKLGAKDPASAPDQSAARVVALLRLPGTAARQDGTARANLVNVIGVTEEFWPDTSVATNGSATTHDFRRISKGGVVLNAALAEQLRAAPGDDVVLRVHKPSALSRDVPITPQSDASVALRLKVSAVAPAAQLGNFSLRANQAPPLNAFLNRDELATAAGLKGKANVILAGAQDVQAGAALAEAFEGRLRSGVSGADYSLEFKIPDSSAVEIRSDRIFLEPAIAAALLGSSNVHGGMPILTYLVNQLRAGERSTPYSMVTAAGPPWTLADMRDDEIIVNQWLADDLRVKPGDSIDLAYFLAESGARLVERTNRFRIRAVVPLAGVHADRTLMPEFPGLAKAESTQEWDAGFPLVHKIRDEDEQYWKKHRGTPKAFVTLAAGRTMWANRFGNLTAIRFAVPPGANASAFGTELERMLARKLDPAALGLRFEPVRAQALAASAQAQDFGELFLGFSFFLIGAALILMALLFQFGLEQRTVEVGTLLALGFPPKRVRQILLGEGILVAFLGGVLGVAGGMVYARLMLGGLTTIWRDAVGTSALHFHVTLPTLLIGLLASVAVCAVTLWFTLRKEARKPARELLAGEGEFSVEHSMPPVRRSTRAAGVALGCGMVAVALIAWALWQRDGASPETFFGAGSLLLVAGLAAAAAALTVLDRAEASRRLTLTAMGVRGVTRRRKRSLASVALLACGSFMIVAVGANRLEAGRDATKRSSGTGGFALLGQSTLPIVRDLNTKAGREFYGLDDKSMAGVSFVPFRVRDGDEASCLNLNRAQNPRLLGVKPELLADRKAFTFAKVVSDLDRGRGWELLRLDGGGGSGAARASSASDEAIPAIGDAASIQWALGKKIGDTLSYTDERGQEFKIRLVGGVANSILQGNLVIDEAEFVKRFPGEGGYRMFFIDTPSNTAAEAERVSAELTRAMQDAGLEVEPAARRLAAFNAVQNTYLNTFQVLGGLGLLVGSAGLGVVVLRNVLERRSELGLLQAVGFRRRSLRWVVLSEHGALLVLGLVIGMAAALAAILPVLLAPGANVHMWALGATLTGVLTSGLIWTWVATSFALRGSLLDALRNE